MRPAERISSMLSAFNTVQSPAFARKPVANAGNAAKASDYRPLHAFKGLSVVMAHPKQRLDITA